MKKVTYENITHLHPLIWEKSYYFKICHDSKPLTLFAQFGPHCPLIAQALIASMAYLKQNFNWINMLQPSQMGPQS